MMFSFNLSTTSLSFVIFAPRNAEDSKSLSFITNKTDNINRLVFQIILDYQKSDTNKQETCHSKPT